MVSGGILFDSGGFWWDSGGIRMDSGGFWWTRVDSGGFGWVRIDSWDSGGFSVEPGWKGPPPAPQDRNLTPPRRHSVCWSVGYNLPLRIRIKSWNLLTKRLNDMFVTVRAVGKLGSRALSARIAALEA